MANNPDPPGRIIVVDDDPTVADVVGRYLVRDGHTVECVHDGHEALRRIAAQPPDLVVLDLMLPGIDGLEVCRRLRERWPIPVVMLTALGDETDRLNGFEIGADDYVTKPFSPRELAMRVRSVLRRARGSGLPDKPDQGVISDRDLTVDLAAHEVGWRASWSSSPRASTTCWFPGAQPAQGVHPGAAAYRGLELVVRRHLDGDRARPQAAREARGGPTLPRRIVTVWGVGYRFEPESP